jgi:hypothetical protein
VNTTDLAPGKMETSMPIFTSSVYLNNIPVDIACSIMCESHLPHFYFKKVDVVKEIQIKTILENTYMLNSNIHKHIRIFIWKEKREPYDFKPSAILYFDKSQLYDSENIIQANPFLKEITLDICRQGPTDAQIMKLKNIARVSKMKKMNNQSFYEMPDNLSDAVKTVLFNAGLLNSTDSHIRIGLLTVLPTLGGLQNTPDEPTKKLEKWATLGELQNTPDEPTKKLEKSKCRRGNLKAAICKRKRGCTCTYHTSEPVQKKRKSNRCGGVFAGIIDSVPDESATEVKRKSVTTLPPVSDGEDVPDTSPAELLKLRQMGEEKMLKSLVIKLYKTDAESIQNFSTEEIRILIQAKLSDGTGEDETGTGEDETGWRVDQKPEPALVIQTDEEMGTLPAILMEGDKEIEEDEEMEDLLNQITKQLG